MIFSTRIKNRDYHLSYSMDGDGDKFLLTFHGFGQSAETLGAVRDAFGAGYTFIHVDLFFHGESSISPPSAPLTSAQWHQIIQAFLEDRKVGKFSALGFSMGCRFIFALLATMPEKISAVYLIAPDGLKMTFWYWLAVYPGRSLFRSTITKPWRFYSIIRWLQLIRFISRQQAVLAQNAMESRRRRRQVYYSWVSFRRFFFKSSHLAGLLRQYAIPVHIFLSKKDKVIRQNDVLPAVKRIKTAQIYQLNTVHMNMPQAAFAIISNKNL